MLIVPIRTAATVRCAPTMNYILIGINGICFLLFCSGLLGDSMASFRDAHLDFQSSEPTVYQFFTYQFLHGDEWHLFGNMLFLWVFGNAVNGKLGNLPYLLFYLAGGVFAAWGYATVKQEDFQLVGASGSIAAITTAYLALFPRSRVTVLVWFFFIHFFELPAMAIIGLKIIVWDNMIAPSLGGQHHVAHAAHLAGYLFGFVGALLMLFLRALPRDQFDILALWKRWRQRREFAAVMANPAAAARARYGAVGRVATVDPAQRTREEQQMDRVAELRQRISETLVRHDLTTATEAYETLMTIDPKQCLSETQQLAIAREFYRTQRFPQAASAFERFVDTYPRSRELSPVMLLLGIIYARDLRQYESADDHLTRSMKTLEDETRRAQCLQWLQDVRTALGRPAYDETKG